MKHLIRSRELWYCRRLQHWKCCKWWTFSRQSTTSSSCRRCWWCRRTTSSWRGATTSCQWWGWSNWWLRALWGWCRHRHPHTSWYTRRGSSSSSPSRWTWRKSGRPVRWKSSTIGRCLWMPCLDKRPRILSRLFTSWLRYLWDCL